MEIKIHKFCGRHTWKPPYINMLDWVQTADWVGFKPFLPMLRRLRDGERLYQEDSGSLREVGSGEDAVAEQYHEDGERAGPFLGEAVSHGLHDPKCAFRVEDCLESWKRTSEI